jgi:SnoaL-like domain
MDGDADVTHDAVTQWLEAHDAAWRSAGHAAIADLFSEAAVYHLGPIEEEWRSVTGPLRGRDAIAAGWLAGGIAGEQFETESEILAIDGPRAVVRRRIRYFKPDGSVESRWDTCWVLDFDGDGRCTEYWEWYVEGPAVPG